MRAPKQSAETKKVLDKISEIINKDNAGRIIIAEESELQKMIANIIVQLDANYVRRDDLRQELQAVLQEMVKSSISSEVK